MATIDGLMMCFSNVAHLPFPERIRAARLAHCDQMSMMPVEVRETMAQGFSIADMRSIAEESGIRITRLDPLVRWTRIWRPRNMSEEYIARIADTPDEFFELAENLGCEYASLNATFPKHAMAVEELIESFASICQRAANHGMQCDLEFIPLWGVPDLETAWRIVGGAAAENGGIVFDTWHYVRGGSSLETLRQVPGRRIHSVQLNDGPLSLPTDSTLEKDCFRRLFPGDGEFPLTEILRVLADIGGLRQLGAEVFNPMLKEMSTEQVAERVEMSVANVLARAGLI
jgi:sugar phosphate isomerase/epimerase